MGLLVASPDPAAITVGTASSPVPYTCDPTDPYMLLDLTPAFDVVVKNCSGDVAGVLIQMAYSTPGGQLGDPNDYGGGELRVDFTGSDQEINVPLVGVIGGSENMVSVRVTGFRLTGGSAAQRLLGNPLTADRAEGTNIISNMVTLTPELEARIRRDLKLRSYANPAAEPLNPDPAQCSFESNQVVADNRGRETLAGILRNKAMCNQNLSTAQSCLGGAKNATHAQEEIGTLLDPETFRMLKANTPTSGSGNSLFNVCCDPGHTTVAVVQCGSFCVQEIGNPRQPLSAAVWIEAKDIQPIAPGVTPGDVDLGCMDFDASFAPKASTAGTLIMDDDDDGIHDECDFLVA
ncbi:MAG: hypothetical protein ACE5ID_05855, partial [Acidobacteriota bacterium]